jgi:hypothetical protein
MATATRAARSTKKSEANVLTPLREHALMVLGRGSKNSRASLDVGDDQPVDMWCHIHGTVNVSPDGKSTDVEKPDRVVMLALALQAAGAAGAKAIRAAWSKTLGGKKRKPPKLPKELLTEAEGMIADATIRVPTTKAGSVTGALKLDLVAPR